MIPEPVNVTILRLPDVTMVAHSAITGQGFGFMDAGHGTTAINKTASRTLNLISLPALVHNNTESAWQPITSCLSAVIAPLSGKFRYK